MDNKIELCDLNAVGTLGIGGYGRVELVRYLKTDRYFALKTMNKAHIRATKQQKNAVAERRILLDCQSEFIVKLYSTYRDSKKIYLLLETCMGGELWTYLRDRGRFDEWTAAFYTASVLEAFDYLHSHKIIFRDLKPENVLLDASGYAKLADFGCAEKLMPAEKAWTICGTPEYAAPEMILNKGHDRAVDLWCLGIFIFELLDGRPPFHHKNGLKTYNDILKSATKKFPFPSHFSHTARRVIKAMCQHKPDERLGYDRLDDVRQHLFFQPIDFVALRKKQLTPPIIPQVTRADDMRNFDLFPLSDNFALDDENSGWDLEFGDYTSAPADNTALTKEQVVIETQADNAISTKKRNLPDLLEHCRL